jgi:hypothetical protein
VAVAVNEFLGFDRDGKNGKYVAGLGKPRGNYFHLATPGGKLVAGMWLSGVNVNNRAVFLAALQKWHHLSKKDRKPGAVKIESPKGIAKVPPKPPVNGIVLRVFTRNMKRNKSGKYVRITKRDLLDLKTYKDKYWRSANGIYTEPMPDVMWITEAEWKALIPKKPKKGDRFPLPLPIAKRLIRYHLIDGTYGIAVCWRPEEIRSEKMTLTVMKTGTSLVLRLKGATLLATNRDLKKAKWGYDARLEGILIYNYLKKRFTRFDIVATGDCWGGDREAGRFARPGRAPLGIAFELATGDRASDLILPKVQNLSFDVLRHYMRAEK